MNTKLYRLQELINPVTGRSLVVDTSNGLSLGAIPGLTHFEEALGPILPLADSIVISPGKGRALGTRSRQDAALLVRADWTNALRAKDFVLPPETIQYIPLLTAKDASALGANGMVMHFLLGYDEGIEAQCLKEVVQLALEGAAVGMPLIVDVQPHGPRVVWMNKAIELGVSYALEGGADGIAIPWPGAESFQHIPTMTDGLPVWIKVGSLDPEAPELAEALHQGAAGLWLDERLFADPDPAARLQALASLVHATRGGAG